MVSVNMRSGSAVFDKELFRKLGNREYEKHQIYLWVELVLFCVRESQGHPCQARPSEANPIDIP